MRSSLYREHLYSVLDWYTSEYGLHPKRDQNIQDIKAYINDIPDDDLLNDLLLDYCTCSIQMPYSFFHNKKSSRLARSVKTVIEHYKKNHSYAKYWADLEALDYRLMKVESFLNQIAPADHVRI